MSLTYVNIRMSIPHIVLRFEQSYMFSYTYKYVMYMATCVLVYLLRPCEICFRVKLESYFQSSLAYYRHVLHQLIQIRTIQIRRILVHRRNIH